MVLFAWEGVWRAAILNVVSHGVVKVASSGEPLLQQRAPKASKWAVQTSYVHVQACFDACKRQLQRCFLGLRLCC